MARASSAPPDAGFSNPRSVFRLFAGLRRFLGDNHDAYLIRPNANYARIETNPLWIDGKIRMSKAPEGNLVPSSRQLLGLLQRGAIKT